MSTNQSSYPDSGQILRHQYGISVAESRTFLLAKRPWRRETRLYSQAIYAKKFDNHETKRISGSQREE